MQLINCNLLEADFNPYLSNNDYVKDWNYDGQDDGMCNRTEVD